MASHARERVAPATRHRPPAALKAFQGGRRDPAGRFAPFRGRGQPPPRPARTRDQPEARAAVLGAVASAMTASMRDEADRIVRVSRVIGRLLQDLDIH